MNSASDWEMLWQVNHGNLDTWMQNQIEIKEREIQTNIKDETKNGSYVPENARIPAVKRPPNCPKKKT